MNGRDDITDGPQSKAGRFSGGGVGASDRSSSGSAVSAASGKSVWSVASSSDNGGEARGEGPALDWEKLESFTVRERTEQCQPKTNVARSLDSIVVLLFFVNPPFWEEKLYIYVEFSELVCFLRYIYI